MKKTLTLFMSLILALSLVGCGNEQVTKSEVSEDTDVEIEEQEEQKEIEKMEENKVYEVGEEAIFKDENDKEMYSLRIDNVKSADKFISEINDSYEINGRIGIFESEYEQVVEVNYTYTNIAKDDEAKLYIAPEDLQVADITGNIGEVTMIPLKKEPQVIVPNTNSNVEGHYALKNKSDEVKIIFFSPMYNKTVTFESLVSEEDK